MSAVCFFAELCFLLRYLNVIGSSLSLLSFAASSSSKRQLFFIQSSFLFLFFILIQQSVIIQNLDGCCISGFDSINLSCGQRCQRPLKTVHWSSKTFFWLMFSRSQRLFSDLLGYNFCFKDSICLILVNTYSFSVIKATRPFTFWGTDVISKVLFCLFLILVCSKERLEMFEFMVLLLLSRKYLH